MDQHDTELNENERYYRDFGERIESSDSQSAPMDDEDGLGFEADDDLDADMDQDEQETDQMRNRDDFRESLRETPEEADERLRDEAERAAYDGED